MPEDITIDSAQGTLVHGAWLEINPNVSSAQLQAREITNRKGVVSIDIRQWKDDNTGAAPYKGPTKSGFRFRADIYYKWRNAMLAVFDALDKHLDVDDQLLTHDISVRKEEEEEA